MQNKSNLDTLSMDDLYNSFKVYEAEIKGQSNSSSNSQNVAFVSSDNTSSTNEAVNIAHDVFAASLHGQAFASTYADDVMFSFFANQSNSPQLDNEDLNQLNERDLNNKSDVFESASDSSVNESEEDNNQANDRYKADEGYHAVPPPYTGNFMPPRPDMSFAGLDDSVFKSAINETVTSVHETKTSASKTSKELITNSGKVPFNTAKQNSLRAAASTSTARYVNNAATRPIVNGAKPSSNNKHSLREREQRTAREKDVEQEAKDAALIEQIEDVQARIDADALLAERLQQEERKQFTVDEQAIMLVDLIAEKREVNDSKQQAKSSKNRSREDHDKESVKKRKLEEDDAKKKNLELVWIWKKEREYERYGSRHVPRVKQRGEKLRHVPQELDGVHDTFHVSNLKKCLADPTLQVPLHEIRVDAKLNFVEDPVKILEREFKKFKRSRISIVKTWFVYGSAVDECLLGRLVEQVYGFQQCFETTAATRRRPLLDDYKKGKKINDLQLITYGDMFKNSNSYLESRGSIEDFVSFREMITSQLLYLRGSSYETLFVLSSSNRGRLLGFLI
nr:reverse transcriptase domain-containing protein [Tanacetum cinerariifolium]